MLHSSVATESAAPLEASFPPGLAVVEGFSVVDEFVLLATWLSDSGPEGEDGKVEVAEVAFSVVNGAAVVVAARARIRCVAVSASAYRTPSRLLVYLPCSAPLSDPFCCDCCQRATTKHGRLQRSCRRPGGMSLPAAECFRARPRGGSI